MHLPPFEQQNIWNFYGEEKNPINLAAFATFSDSDRLFIVSNAKHFFRHLVKAFNNLIYSVNKFLWNRCHVCSSEFYNLRGCFLLPLFIHWFEKISGLFSWLRRVDEPWKNPTPGEGLLLGQAGLPHPLHWGCHEVQSENLQGKRWWNEVSSPECGSF